MKRTTKQQVLDRQAEYRLYGWKMLDNDTIARKLCGCYDWQGMMFGIDGWSLQTKAIQKLVDQYAYGWIVIEIQYGDGISKYGLEWSQDRCLSSKS